MHHLANQAPSQILPANSTKIVLWALMAFGVLFSSNNLQAAVHVASPGGDSISQCISVSAVGDTINIEAGLYNESVIINKAVTLVGLAGSSNTTLTGPNSDLNVMSVLVDGVNISGLTIEGGRYGLAIASPVTQIQLSDCVLSETGSYQLQLPPGLVSEVVADVTLVPHTSGQLDAVLIHTGSITSSTTWQPLPGDMVYYLNTATVTVAGASNPVLNIAPGAVIKNWRSSIVVGLSIGSPGGLMADNVIFTSIHDDSMGGDTSGDDGVSSHGSWYGIKFQAGATEESCQLTNCDIRYGGRFNHALWATGGGSFNASNCNFLTNTNSIRIEGDVEPVITNCTLAPNGDGITVYEPSTSASITNCTITQDSGYPVNLPLQMVDSFLNLQGNSYVPNGDNTWNAVGITNSTITESLTLSVLPHDFVYYLVSSTVTVGGSSNPVLTIPSGFVFKNWRSNIIIGPNGSSPGGLMADNVIFTSIHDDSMGGNTSGDAAVPVHGNWYDIQFQAGAMEGVCQLNNCDIRYGGRFNHVVWARNGGSFSAVNCAFLSNTKSIRIEGGGESIITNCTLAPNSDGITVYEPSTSAGITGCTITQDSGYPANLPIQMVDDFLNVQGNSYIPNGMNTWNAVGITNSTVTESQTLPVLPHDFVYYLVSSTVTVGGPTNPILTIPSGFVLKNWRSSIIVGPSVGSPGGLMADNVIFTSIHDDAVGEDTSGNGTAPSHGSWYDIQFKAGALEGSSHLNTCDIRYGGRFNHVIWARSGGTFSATNCNFLTNTSSIRIEGGGEPVITNCTLAPQSGGITVYEPSSSSGISDCTITQNSGYPANLPLQMVDNFLNVQGNSYIPNGANTWNALGITSSTIIESLTLPVLPHDFVYYLVSSTVTVGGPESPVLTIPSGFVLKNWRSNIVIGPNVDSPGGLMAENVIFTSIYDDSMGGDTSGNAVAPVHGNWYDIQFQAGAVIELCQLNTCDIRFGGRFNHALWARNGGSFSATNCVFQDNTSSIRIEGGGEPVITNCTMAPFNDGMTIYDPSSGSDISNCTITQGTGFPVLLPMDSVNRFLFEMDNVYIPRGDNMWDAVGITTSNITESMTLPILPHEFVYYLPSSEVKVGGPSRPVLTINPGTIIKNYRSSFSIGQGASSPGGIHFEGVTFTSLYDDSVGGDTSGNATAPVPGDWYYLKFNSTSSEVNSVVLDCDFRYGGRFGNGTIYSLTGSSVALNTCRVSKSSSAALFSSGTDSRPRVYYCEFFDNYDGIRTVANGRPAITRSCFENNSHLSIDADAYTDGLGDLDAQECWWGAPSGPVVGTDVSENVDFASWSTVATCLNLSEVPVLPTVFSAKAPAPNPFNPSTQIRFDLPRSESVHLRIFDIRGSLVRELIEGDAYQPGNHSVTWNGRDNTGRSVPSGVYFYALEAGTHHARHKMLLLK